MKKFCCTIVALAIAQIFSASAVAQTARNSAGSWDTATQWTPNDVPDTAAESALMSFGFSTSLGSSYTIDDLTIQGSMLTINGANTLTVDVLTQQFNGVVNGTGTIIANGASVFNTGSMAGTGTSQFNGDLSISANSGSVASGGRTVITGGSTTFGTVDQMVITGPNTTWNNTGTMTKSVAANTSFGNIILNDSVFNNSGTFVSDGAGTFSIEASAGGVFNNTGLVRVDAGTMTIENYTHSGAAQIDVKAGATLNIQGNTNVNGGGISGNGTLDSNTVALGAGTFVAPGAFVGTLTINGDLTMDPDATFKLQLDTGGTFDFLNVTGSAAVAGANVEVEFLNGYTPTVGNAFTFLTAAGGGTGLFDAPTFVAPGGWMGDISSNGGSYTLTITAVPEPGSLSLLAVGALGCTLVRRRRSA